MVKYVNVDNPFVSDLIDKANISVLLGSGVSIWKPTGLPTGQAISLSVFRALFCIKDEIITKSEPKYRIQGIIQKIPFEVIMEKCPVPQLVESVVRKIYNISRPNPVHKRFAKLLLDGEIKSIITTNYDCCIDHCLRQDTDISYPVTKILREADYSAGIHSHIYFKIHGSAEDENSDTLIVRLRQEGRLPVWKREILKQLLCGNTLLVIGYSGLDFDICHELVGSGIKRIIWNVLNRDQITLNARQVLEKLDGYVIEGDMRYLHSRRFAIDAGCTLEQPVDVESIFRSQFSSENKLLWQARLLNVVACSSFVFPLLKSGVKNISPNISRLINVELAQAYFHRGKYKRSALMFMRSAYCIPQTDQNRKDRALLLLNAADAWRCYGKFYAAFGCIRMAEIINTNYIDSSDKEISCRIAIIKLALLRNLYRIAVRFSFQKLINAVQSKAKAYIEGLPSHFVQIGAWDELQHLRLWADRLGLPQNTVLADDNIGPPHPRDGYIHLGQTVSQMMAFRDDVEVQGLHNTRNVEELIEMAEFLGSLPELWKLRYLVLKKIRSSRSFCNLFEFLLIFIRCEYTIGVRAYMLVMGG